MDKRISIRKYNTERRMFQDLAERLESSKFRLEYRYPDIPGSEEGAGHLESVLLRIEEALDHLDRVEQALTPVPHSKTV